MQRIEPRETGSHDHDVMDFGGRMPILVLDVHGIAILLAKQERPSGALLAPDLSSWRAIG
jgi:hypothetical protein